VYCQQKKVLTSKELANNIRLGYVTLYYEKTGLTWFNRIFPSSNGRRKTSVPFREVKQKPKGNSPSNPVGPVQMFHKFYPKVKTPLYLIKHYAMQTYGGVKVYLHHSWPRHWIEMSVQIRALPTVLPGKMPPVLIGWGWVGLRAVMDAVEGGKNVTVGNTTRVVQLAAGRYTDWAIPYQNRKYYTCYVQVLGDSQKFVSIIITITITM
jgi:hypothetical protein